MSGGFVQIIASVLGNPMDKGSPRRKQYVYIQAEIFYAVKDIKRIVKKSMNDLGTINKQLIEQLSGGDHYIITMQDGESHIVHPNCRERLGRILSGNDDPLRDLVDELRYNPHVGLQVRAAQEDFYRNK